MRPRSSAARPGVLQAELLGRALAAGGVEHDVRDDPLAARELRERPAASPLDADDRLPEAEDDAEVAQVVLQRLR